MIILVNGSQADQWPAEIEAMHRLRARVFNDRLGWDVAVEEGMERDGFDRLHPDYLIQRAPSGEVTGCVRMLPSSGPTMLRDVFPQLAEGVVVPATPHVWEASRYCVDHAAASASAGGLRYATFELFAGMVEYGLARGLTDVLAVTDLRMERILTRAGWDLRRYTAPRQVGLVPAVAGVLEVSHAALRAIRLRGGLSGSVLWMPVNNETHHCQEAA